MTSTTSSPSVAGLEALKPPVIRLAYPGLGRLGDSWMPERLIITIDGPAGTGKSTVARRLAKRLGLDFLDTGAMYRAAALIAVERKIPLQQGSELVRAVAAADLHFDWTIDPPELLCDGHSVMKRIRDEDVTKIVSPIAGIAELRRLMVEKQRQIAAVHQRLVTEGRDQGSVAFPDASVKLFIFASAEVRAKRRTEELRGKGIAADEDRILSEIIDRDRSDMSRAVGPLICPEDAQRVDTSFLSVDQVVEELERRVRATVTSEKFEGGSGGEGGGDDGEGGASAGPR